MTHADPGLGRLQTLLEAGHSGVPAVPPQDASSYLARQREASADRRMQACVRLTRTALAQALGDFEADAEGVPAAGAWSALARRRYGPLPGSLRNAQVDPEHLPDLEEFDVARIASPVGIALEAAGVRGCLVGALAAGAHGEPAGVSEIEFLVDLPPAKVPELVRNLGELFWFQEAALLAAAEQQGVGVLFQLPYFLRIGLRDLRADPRGAATLERRVRIEGASCGRLWVASAEDLVVRTLLAWRDAEDEQAEAALWREAAMLLAVQGAGLDRAYLDTEAAGLDLSDTLAQAREQAGVG